MQLKHVFGGVMLSNILVLFSIGHISANHRARKLGNKACVSFLLSDVATISLLTKNRFSGCFCRKSCKTLKHSKENVVDCVQQLSAILAVGKWMMHEGRTLEEGHFCLQGNRFWQTCGTCAIELCDHSSWLDTWEALQYGKDGCWSSPDQVLSWQFFWLIRLLVSKRNVGKEWDAEAPVQGTCSQYWEWKA